MNTPGRQPSLLQSIIPLVMMFVILMGGRLYLNYRIEPLILCSAVIAGLMAWYLRCPWQNLEEAILNKIDVAMQGMLVIFSVGCMVGAWMFCGTVPYMVYWGLQLVNPNYMLLSAFLICTLTSCCTGTSWGSAATIGVAMIGIAQGLGMDEAFFSWEHAFEGFEALVEGAVGDHAIEALPPRFDFFSVHESQRKN